jgi:ATP-dependent Clp protease ATP-binding subunit ClpX
MTEFDEDRIKRIVALAQVANEQKQQNWNAESIFKRLDAAIIGNDKYKRSLAICTSDYLGSSKLRNHLLVVGPSGSGKTYLLEQCLPDFGIPFHMIDASGLVPSGYKGNTLQESLEEYFRLNVTSSARCIIILDEFDKISEKANGGDTFKSHSIQSELLALIQGKKEGSIDTRNSLWILAGAFVFTDEMKRNPPSLSKQDLLKYGFKNELIGRITKIVQTELPTVEQVVRRVANDKIILTFLSDLHKLGYDVDFTDEAFLKLAMAAQSPVFGMRIIPTAIADLKEFIIFDCQKGNIQIEPEMVERVLPNVKES